MVVSSKGMCSASPFRKTGLRDACSEWTASALEKVGRLIGLALVNHPDGPGRALFSAYAASLAVIIVDFHRDGLLDDPLGAIHPAKKAGLPPCSGWNAFRTVYLRSRRPPVTGLSGFSLAKFRSRNRKGVFMGLAVFHGNPYGFYSAAHGGDHRNFQPFSRIKSKSPEPAGRPKIRRRPCRGPTI